MILNKKKRFIFFMLLFWFFTFLAYPSTLRMVLDSMPMNLDPRVGTDQASQRIHQIIFNGLFKKTKNFYVEKDLVENYKFLSSTKIYFKLREGVFFHNGKELTSDDVKWTFESLLSRDFHTLRKGAFKSIKKIVKKGKYELIFELKHPDSSLVYNLVIGIIPAGAGKDFSNNPVGTGPFVFEKREHNTLFFRAYKRYFKGKPKIDELIIKVIKDPITRVLTLKKREADIAINCIPPDFLKSIRGIRDLNIKKVAGNTMYYLGLNLKDPLLKNLDFRKALSYSINYRELIKFIMKGYARRAYGLLPPEHWAYTSNLKKFYFDLKKAKFYLKKSGFEEPTIEFKCANKKVSKRIAVALKYYWERLGINVKIKIYEFSTFYRDIVNGNFQIYPLAWVGILSPDIYMYTSHSSYIPPAGANRAHYLNPEVDLLLERALDSYDMILLKNIYGKVERIVSEDIPFIPLWFADNIVVYNKRVKDISIYPSGEYYFLEKIKVED